MQSVIFFVYFFFHSVTVKTSVIVQKYVYHFVVLPSGSKFLHLVTTRKSKKGFKIFISPPLSVLLQLLFWYILVINFLFPLLTIATLFWSDSTQMCKPHHIQICFYFSLPFFLNSCFKAAFCFMHG